MITPGAGSSATWTAPATSALRLASPDVCEQLPAPTTGSPRTARHATPKAAVPFRHEKLWVCLTMGSPEGGVCEIDPGGNSPAVRPATCNERPAECSPSRDHEPACPRRRWATSRKSLRPGGARAGERRACRQTRSRTPRRGYTRAKPWRRRFVWFFLLLFCVCLL